MDIGHLERLSRAECRQLLPTAPVGRLAVPTAHFPTLEPVSFAVVEDDLVVAVPAGSAGDAVAAGTSVTFEADVADPNARQAWSVVVSGAVHELDADVAPLVAPLLRPWPVAADDRLRLIRPEQVSGHRMVSGSTATPPAGTSSPSGPRPAVPVPDVIRWSFGADQALSLLERGGQTVGRLVLTLNGRSRVFLLNYAVDGGAVVFRTEVGAKLVGITRSMATFEVDSIDESGQGWAVAFEGLAQEVLDADPLSLRARTAALALNGWPGHEQRSHVVRIMPYRVHGTAWTAVAATPVAPGSESAEQR